MPERRGRRPVRETAGTIDWCNLLFLICSPLACLIALPLYISAYGLGLGDLLSMAVMIGLSGLAITAGYHRYFSHRSYECSPAVQTFYLIFGAAALQAPVMEWVADHRNHHRFVDREGDRTASPEVFLGARWLDFQAKPAKGKQFERYGSGAGSAREVLQSLSPGSGHRGRSRFAVSHRALLRQTVWRGLVGRSSPRGGRAPQHIPGQFGGSLFWAGTGTRPGIPRATANWSHC